jgi:formylglycine-generating enzyme required for sulfatase activity
MKYLVTSIILSCLSIASFAQIPQKFSYQTVIRNNSNQLLANQQVGIKISVLQGSENGSAVYAETHNPLTNSNGLASLEIGGGTLLIGNFANINWANGPFFVKTETDPNSGNNYTITNTPQLLSVPYALYAAKAPDQQQFTVSLTGDTLYLQNGGFVNIPGISAANTPLNIETALIPAGTFTMGSPTTEPQRSIEEVQHQVTLSAFRMSKYEISNSQFAAFLNAKSIGSNGLYNMGTYPTQVLIEASNGLTTAGSIWQPVAGKENFPVINVTWYGASEFAMYAGGRLPTEAEWEYACRGGTTTPFNTGNCLDYTQANYYWPIPYNDCSNANTNWLQQSQAVNSFSPNAFGLYNMHGNVWEWCADWEGTYSSTAQTNPAGPSTGSARIIRGGGYNGYGRECRSANRLATVPSNYQYIFGFRVAFAP